MAQRSFHVDQHFQMLQALKPIFRHWVAELAQIAAHAETLTNMLVAKDKDLQQMQDDALADVDVLCPCLSYMCFVLVSFLTSILGSLPCAEVRMWEFFRQSAVPLVMTPLLQKASSPYKM